VRGELRKVAHMRITWALVALFTLFTGGSQLLLASGPNTGVQLQNDPLGAFYNVMEGDLSLVRGFGGIVLLILTAHVVGLEYQQGTIRILLGRGVGRLQLLGAKVLALTLVALGVLALGLVIESVFTLGIVSALAGGHQPWEALDGQYWANTGFYLLCVLISMAATLLLGVAASVVGRSLAFGLAVGLSWFAADNLAALPLTVLARFTHSDVWLSVSGFLLGPLLNRLPNELGLSYGASRPVDGFGIMPLVHVGGAQALLTIAVYAVVFTVAAVVLTWRRDVLE
jgi:ABC-type transport system involved in multi-copper enzyme maturation permease subunit